MCRLQLRTEHGHTPGTPPPGSWQAAAGGSPPAEAPGGASGRASGGGVAECAAPRIVGDVDCRIRLSDPYGSGRVGSGRVGSGRVGSDGSGRLGRSDGSKGPQRPTTAAVALQIRPTVAQCESCMMQRGVVPLQAGLARLTRRRTSVMLTWHTGLPHAHDPLHPFPHHRQRVGLRVEHPLVQGHHPCSVVLKHQVQVLQRLS